MTSTTKPITFELGEFSIDASFNVEPLLHQDVSVVMPGDVLLQFEWDRQTQGKWDNLFLFKVDPESLEPVLDPSNIENIGYYTLKGNFSNRNITTDNIEGWALPRNEHPYNELTEDMIDMIRCMTRFFQNDDRHASNI